MPVLPLRRSPAAALCLVLSFTPLHADDNVLAGYSPAASRAEREWEVKFRAVPSPDKQREYMRYLTARPHHVGSPYGKQVAEWLLKQFQDWGFDAKIETFDVLFPTPRERALELVEPRKYTARLSEPAIPSDPTSDQAKEQLPTYNAYSGDGDVTAPLIYVNYGMPSDYEELDRLGIQVKGAIVISRYGNGWRGVKAKVAAEHGALGCLIYSDPGDDGYSEGETYPAGAFRPIQGVQRGSVMDTQYPGDPLTPGKPSTPGTPRLPLKDALTIQKIPVLPISYGDAQPLLAAIEGRVAPPDWRGSLPLTYRIGPGPAKVHLKVFSNWEQKTLYNVIARMPGETLPDEWVLRGNHHDAWVNGAEDPISGVVAMLEEARAFGELKKQGWKPKRTLIYCAWDGEEPGLLGSTEWVEAHEDELLQHAVAYFNSDTNGRGYFQASGSHVLEKFINSVAREITDPEKDIPVWKRRQSVSISRAHSADDREEIRRRPDLRIGALGDGSDYTAFIHHLGIPSADIRYGGEMQGGIYHSIYDDFYWYTHFGDPGFLYGRALSQTMGSTVMRLADAEMLPFDFTNFADTMRKYLGDVQKLLKTQQDEIRERNRQIEDGVFEAISDPTKPVKAPPMRAVPPHFNFAPLENSIDALAASAAKLNKEIDRFRSNQTAPDTGMLSRINRLMMQSGPKLTDPAGLPGRPWFKNQIYAPGAYTGYEAKPLPGVLEAMDRKDWAEAESQIPRAAQALDRETELIDQLTDTVLGAGKKIGYRYYVVGEPGEQPATTIPGVALMGGGTDQDEAFRWLCAKTGSGNFLVLRASGADAYNPYVHGLCPALKAVETLVVDSRNGAAQPFVIERIRHAGALFLSGGSQDNYINFWQGTPMQEAMNAAIARGVPVGGTSAGLAVLAEYNFSALKDTVLSKEALPNPFDDRVTIGRGFLRIPHLEGKITDSHFVARDRMGRLIAFLARISIDGGTAGPEAIGIDEKSALLMEPDGRATLVGQGNAYFVRAPGPPHRLTRGAPLTYSNLAVYRLSPGFGYFDIGKWIGDGGANYKLSAVNGQLHSTQSGNQIY